MYEIKEYNAFLGRGRNQISSFACPPKNIALPSPLMKIRIGASPDEICPFYAPQNPSLSQYLPAFALIIEEETGMGKIELNLQEMEGS